MLRLFFFIGLCLICWSCFTQEAGSFNNLDEISKKVDQVQNLCYENKREEAKALLQKLELLSGSDIIVDTSQYAYALSLIAKGYTDMGEMILALKLYNQANTFIVKGLYKNDSLFSVNLGYIAQIYFYQRNYDSATLVIKKALGIQEKKLGKQNRAYAKSLVIFANIEVDLGNYEHAILLAEESKKILESKVGIENLDYANNLTLLAKANSYSGNYSIAEPMLFEAMRIQEKLKEANSIERAHSLSTLANLYTDNGNYEAADSLFTQALFVVGKILGRQSLEYSSILSDNALLFRLTGRFEKAEEALLHDKAICELKLGKEHLDYSTACNNLALFYQDMGNYELAEPLYVESKDLTEKLVGKETPDYSTMLNNLGYLYHEMGLYSKAVLLNLEDKNLCPKVFGKNHPACVTSLYHLADAYYEQGKYHNADSLYAEVIARWKKYFGTSNPDYARSLYSYGKLQMAMNNLTVADSLLSEAKRIQEKVEGKESPDYLPTCIVLSKLYERQGKWQVSEKLQQEIQRIQFANLIKSVSYLSVNELAKYIRSFEQTNDLLYSFLVHRILSQKPVGLLTELAFDYLLFYKGFLLSSANKLNVLGGLSKDASELNQKRKMYYRLLSKEYSKPVIERDLKIVKDLQDKANTIEKQLTKMVSGYSGFSTQVHWLDLKLKLKPGEAVAEFVSFRKEFPVVSDSVMYALEILKYGSSSPEFIFLCEQKSIDSILHSDNERKSDYVNELYTISGRGAVSLEARSRSLYELFWEPIEKSLEGIKTIYFSPAGLLHRINLDAIPVSETETLADRYQLIQLNSTRQVVISDTVKSDNIDAVLYGGINFEKDSMSKDEEPALVFMAPRDGSTSGSNGINRGESWNYLPGTDREVHSIEKILKIAGLTVTSYRAFSATEESFKSIGTNGQTSPKIIHVATHGFFFADQKVKTTKSQVEGNKGQQDVVFKISDQPMLRSGLIMAGGNVSWKGSPTLEGREDGILTAYEISQMNLSNTELVVLSACETGLGDIQGNEGVYGLQRAFKIAGVKYIIMSLWQVPDKQTSLLMTTFYKKWLEAEGPDKGGNKMTIPEAFHAAQKELRDNGLDPYNWAGFVLVE